MAASILVFLQGYQNRMRNADCLEIWELRERGFSEKISRTSETVNQSIRALQLRSDFRYN